MAVELFGRPVTAREPPRALLGVSLALALVGQTLALALPLVAERKADSDAVFDAFPWLSGGAALLAAGIAAVIGRRWRRPERAAMCAALSALAMAVLVGATVFAIGNVVADSLSVRSVPG